MRTLCSLMLICCLLFSYTTPAVGALSEKEKIDWCQKKGGYCYFYCFYSHKKIGSCFPSWPYCCKPLQ
ncbi:beta-defensin 9-like [Apodemus sylvaticus]|uniref:beta-defensin 9-like n=1 Tax=Apodemus sylvaticus TaxID=10129 RepID=UPI002243CAC2|nr:beta-defensin 9-like [Apodemus sylvaticus]